MIKIFTTFLFAFFLVLNQTQAQNNALQFDGGDDRVTGTMSGLPQGNAARTIEAWVRYSTGNDVTIFNYGTNATNQTFTLHLYNGVYIIGQGNDLSTGFTVNNGSWHHLAVTHDGTTTKVYVDGIERGSAARTYNTTGTDFQIGASYRGSYIFHYNGTIDEVRVWNIARTQSEIQAAMNAELSSGTGLVAAYHFNQGSAGSNNSGVTTLTDATGSYNGTLNNFALSGTSSNWVTSDIVLSVELLSFTGKNTEGGNLLTWATANEQNNKGFSVERRVGDDWETLGFKTANNKASNYQFVDKNPLSTSYYRLREIDNDGKETLSKVISIQTNGAKGKLAVYPNPVSNLLTIENTEGSNFLIFNLLGQHVLSGKAASQVDVSALPQGSYVLKVGTEQVKFIKQ